MLLLCLEATFTLYVLTPVIACFHCVSLQSEAFWLVHSLYHSSLLEVTPKTATWFSFLESALNSETI